MNVNLDMKSNYENNMDENHEKTKPIQTQFKAKQSQFKPIKADFNAKQSQNKPNQTQPVVSLLNLFLQSHKRFKGVRYKGHRNFLWVLAVRKVILLLKSRLA
jgi:hypothetical protein